MFKRSFASKDRAGKATKISKKSFGDHAKIKLLESLDAPPLEKSPPRSTSAVVTIAVGRDQRLFAAHEEVLHRSPFLKDASREIFFSGAPQRRIDLTNEDPETFSIVLEYLYKNDYSPRLLHSKSRGYYLEGYSAEDNPANSPHSLRSRKNLGGHPTNMAATLFHTGIGDYILRDTAAYCAGHRYGLPELQRLALRKQGLQSGIDVGTILRSMRFAYANTPDSDSRLRAHFLALVVRARKTFKRSGTMQMEMTKGGAMFFDLFVALCNHLDDLSVGNITPKTI